MIPRGALLLLVALLLPGPRALGGQEAPPDSTLHSGSSLRVFLLTLGQGSYIWERFGHNAIWIHDTQTGRGAAYNWGVFSFHQEDFIPRLARGTMLYWMEPQDPDAMVEEARYFDRSVWLQELALSPAQKLELLAFVQWNALEENKFYRYDYYLDNCSTRVRDALDRVLGGQLRQAFLADTTHHTFRWHTRRLLAAEPAAYLGIQFVLGPRADQPITRWEEMFLPVALMEGIREIQLPDESGALHPLVTQEREIFQASRPPEPQGPPFALPWFLLAGVGWGGAFLALARGGPGMAWVRRTGVALLGGLWTLLVAVGGTALLAAWVFTDHQFWFQNLNLMQVNPFFLPLPVAFLLLARGAFPRWGRDMLAALAVVSVVGGAMQLLPGVDQGNGEILALTLPLNLALWAGATWLVPPGERALGGEEVRGGGDPQGSPVPAPAGSPVGAGTEDHEPEA